MSSDKNKPGDDHAHARAMDSIIASYNRFVPQESLGLLGKDSITSVALGDHVEKRMTILFSDIRDFTLLSEEMTPRETFVFINDYLSKMAPVISKHGGIIDKYLGDGVMALFPVKADDAVHCAIGMLEKLADYNAARRAVSAAPVNIGIGLNTGLLMLGIVGGSNRMESTVVSDAVNVAARVEAMTKTYGVPLLISEHTYYGLKDASHHHIRFIDRVRVKGKTQPQSVYEVYDADPPALRTAKNATKTLFGEALAHYHFKDVAQALELLEECLRQAPEDTVARVYHERCRYFLETGYHESTGEVDLQITWDDSLLLGVPEVDEQHRQLFRRIAGFVEAVRKEQGYSQIQKMTDFMENYIARHFETEEKWMAKTGYPFLSLQVEQHQRFRKHFNGFKKEVEDNLGANPTFLLFRTQVLVIDWLVHHVEKLDKHFGKFLRQKNERETVDT